MKRCARVSFRVATDRVQVEEILETHAGEDYPPEEQWPTLEQVRRAQQAVTEDTVTELGLVTKDGYLWGPTGAAMFDPATTPASAAVTGRSCWSSRPSGDTGNTGDNGKAVLVARYE